MNDVIAFPKPPKEDPRIWTCGHCGCQTFYLYESGTTECALCGSFDHEQRGGWAAQVRPDETFDDSRPHLANTPHGTADFARAAVLKSADDATCAIVVIWPDGRLRTWSIFDRTDSDERKAWVRRSLGAAAGLILNEPVGLGDLPE